MLDGIVKSFLFGLTIALSVGPIALLIFNYGLSSGLRTATLAGLGAAVADLTYAVVAFTVGAQVVESLTRYQNDILIVSSFALVAIGAWLVLRAWEPSLKNTSSETRSSRPFTTTLALTSVNPLTIAVFLSFAMQLPESSLWISRMIFVLSLFAGSLCGQLFFACSGAVGATIFTRRNSIRAIGVASGIGIVAIGIYGVLRLYFP